ncbi:MAG TPA: MBL fold metallo-hydrolase [Candidatus Aquilonibacter sp.]|nr:MBL fold metallo-hydrolase [Candidatus Aquilonibacter sp.]
MSRIALVRASNPSAMTLTGTNTYVIDAGNGEALVIDPGPDDARHLEALLANASSRKLRITAIALTHGHPDHAPLAATLAARTGARVYAHPYSEVPHDTDLPLEGDLTIAQTALHVIDAPGHTFEHAIFYEPRERALFTGDVILGEGTVVIAPPGGAMRPYMTTLARLRDEFPDAARIYGGHGPVVEDARAKIAEYIAHREQRQNELLEALRAGPQTIPQLVQSIYGETRRILWPAAARQLLAYLMALTQEDVVHARALERPLTPEETAILNPSWESIVGAEHAPLVEAELGAMLKLDKIYVYSLLS